MSTSASSLLFQSLPGFRSHIALFLSVFLAAITPGCGPVRAKAVDVEVARRTLTNTLDLWKKGGSIDELRQADPEVVVQERLWSQGNQLLEYTLLDEGRAEDANWYCEVELTLSSTTDGKSSKKKVTYVVGTDPVLTVFHAIL